MTTKNSSLTDWSNLEHDVTGNRRGRGALAYQRASLVCTQTNWWFEGFYQPPVVNQWYIDHADPSLDHTLGPTFLLEHTVWMEYDSGSWMMKKWTLLTGLLVRPEFNQKPLGHQVSLHPPLLQCTTDWIPFREYPLSHLEHTKTF